MSEWKNAKLFDDRQQIPWSILEPTLREAGEMGTRAIEVTGGGEPLIYRDRDRLFPLLSELNFEVGLVTNGVAATDDTFDMLAETLLWARVSIDAGTPEEYSAVRKVPASQWGKAWLAVESLASRMVGRHKESHVGVGFVLTNENHRSLLDFCKRAKDAGATNVRLSMRFGPGGNGYYDAGVLDGAEAAAKEASAQLDDVGFAVIDRISERRQGQASAVQDYHACPASELLCVIGGDSKVYHCCTLSFHPDGLIGDLAERGISEIWRSFIAVDPRQMCRVPCLYEKRNLAMIDIVESTGKLPDAPATQHRNFI
jgi:MoaA/NifB/PqqE/SkfB family radical SAM enzyme